MGRAAIQQSKTLPPEPPRRNRGLVEEARTQLLRVLLEEGVPAVQAAEQIDNGIKPLVHFVVGDALQPLPERFISVLRDINRRELLLVHKVLELVVTGFLEVLLVLKAVADELIHICFTKFTARRQGIFTAQSQKYSRFPNQRRI